MKFLYEIFEIKFWNEIFKWNVLNEIFKCNLLNKILSIKFFKWNFFNETTAYDKLVAKVNNLDTSDFARQTKQN